MMRDGDRHKKEEGERLEKKRIGRHILTDLTRAVYRLCSNTKVLQMNTAFNRAVSLTKQMTPIPQLSNLVVLGIPPPVSTHTNQLISNLAPNLERSTKGGL